METCCKCGVRFRPKQPSQKYCSRACFCPPVKPKRCRRCKATFTPQQNSKIYCTLWCFQNRHR